MNNLFQKIPFLRITLAFALGVIIAKYFEFGSNFPIVCSLIFLIVLIVLHHKYSFKIGQIFGVFVFILFVFLGATIYSNYNLPPHFFKNGIYAGTILEKPQEKANSYKSLVLLNTVKSNNSVSKTNEKVLVYFAKNENIKTLQPGTQILFNTSPTPINNFGTPYSFDYKSYLQNKRIYRQVYLSSDNWKPTLIQTNSLPIKAELLRERLLKIIRHQNLGANETEILSALTLGYKRDLEPETKRIFSAAGAMHVLAVSGLHVGIIFLVFSQIFGFLKKRTFGRVIFVVSVVTLLWMYAFITGLSPSVLRASTMLTIVIIGSNLQRKANIYNSLAASALILLLINPNNLCEVGFQLSYSAVFGIVFLQPKLANIWLIKNKIGKFFWNLFCVSVAAQIATFPLVAFYFNQFPSYFWATNIFVIPAVTILIPLTILLLIVFKIPALSFAVAFLIKWIIKGMYFILQSLESFPYSVVDVSFRSIELLFLLCFLFFVFVVINKPRANSLKLGLTFFLLLLGFIFANNLKQRKSKELIVFNTSSNITLQIINGRNNYVISETEIANTDFIFQQIVDIKRKKRLAKPTFLNANSNYEDDFILIKNGIIGFDQKTISIQNRNPETSPNLSPDYLITKQNFKFETQEIKPTTEIITSSYISTNQPKHKMHSLKTQGAFCKKW